MVTPLRMDADRARRARRDLRMAWVAVGLLPVAFVLAMIAGEGLLSTLGYEPGGEEPVPVGPALLASVPALLILFAPCITAMYFGYRAHRRGLPGGQVPAWIGAAMAVTTLATNVLSFLVGLLSGRQ